MEKILFKQSCMLLHKTWENFTNPISITFEIGVFFFSCSEILKSLLNGNLNLKMRQTNFK